MNPTPSPFDLQAAVRRIVPNVFETMLSFSTTPGAAKTSVGGERVSGTIGIAGDTLSGAVYLHFSEALARRAASTLLGLDSGEAADSSAVNDVVSELTNMTGGGIKSALCDAGQPCAMSTPSIVRGPAFVIELPPGLRSETFAFDCQGERLTVEVHLKLD